MRKISKDLTEKAFNALIVTFAVAASFHLLLVGFVAIIKADISYVNPLDFLGISILLPEYRESTAVAAGGWVALAILFFTILYIRIHYHLYVAIIRENWLVRTTTKLSETTKRIGTKDRKNYAHFSPDRVKSVRSFVAVCVAALSRSRF